VKSDPGYYPYWAYKDRPKITWPNGAKLAFWVAPNIEFYELNPPKNPARAAWPHPYPAVPGYSIRDYGNRVGHMRQMKLLDKYSIRGSVSLSAALCDHHPEIIAMCRERDWEFFSHGIYNTRYTYGMTEADDIRANDQRATWHQRSRILKSRLISSPSLAAFTPAISFTMINRLRCRYEMVNALFRFPTRLNSTTRLFMSSTR
jgi:hypothetical protein